MTWLRSMNVAASIDPFGYRPLAALIAALNDARDPT
jgi:hypothetical protein